MAKPIAQVAPVSYDYALAHRVTIQQVIATVRSFGLTCTRKNDEYRVNLKPEQGGTEDTAYYTGCPADAIGTAQAMAAHFAKFNPPQPTVEELRIERLEIQVKRLKLFADYAVQKTGNAALAEELSCIVSYLGIEE